MWLYWRAYARADGRLFGYPAEALLRWTQANDSFRSRHERLSDWIIRQDFEEFAEEERDREAIGYPLVRNQAPL